MAQPVIPALGRWRQEDHKSEASLGYIQTQYLKKKEEEKILNVRPLYVEII
jgi:hypothetical protein